MPYDTFEEAVEASRRSMIDAPTADMADTVTREHFHQAQGMLSAVASKLRRHAGALKTVGLTAMADVLHECADEVVQARFVIDAHDSRQVLDSAALSERSLFDLVSAVISGIDIGRMEGE